MRSVEQLLQDSRLWRGKRGPDYISNGAGDEHHKVSISTGNSSLDRQLHWRGWPLHCSTELLCDQWGIGELELLMPVLRQASANGGKIAWINPPFTPYPPALAARGIAPQQCLLLYPQSDDQWWAAEQTLASSAFAVVITWFSQQSRHMVSLLRLQNAAKKGRCLHFHYRPVQLEAQPSPARLRLSLRANSRHLALEVIKQPGGWSGQQLTLKRPQALLFQQQPTLQWPVYNIDRQQPSPTTDSNRQRGKVSLPENLAEHPIHHHRIPERMLHS